MLILTRKIDQDVMIETPSGEVIWVKVLGVERDRVKLGISAPASVTVLRSELIDASGYDSETSRLRRAASQ